MYLINSVICLILLLSGIFQGNLKNFFFSQNVCMVVCFIFKTKVVLDDGVFCQSLSLPVSHSSEMVNSCDIPHAWMYQTVTEAGCTLYSVSVFCVVWEQFSNLGRQLCINAETKRCAVLFLVVQVPVMLVVSRREVLGL